MKTTGAHILPPPLNPTAQEFRPTYHRHQPPPILLLPSPPLPPPPPPQPTRTLLLSPITITTSESTIRKNLEIFGDIRAVQMERIHSGVVTIHFYDIRHAVQALSEIQQQHMQQQFRLRKHFQGFRSFGREDLAARGLVDGKVIWAE
ncbi:protein terminal ear1, partial [Tanacetum coccineum]